MRTALNDVTLFRSVCNFANALLVWRTEIEASVMPFAVRNNTTS
jgi:hypothetical protein